MKITIDLPSGIKAYWSNEVTNNQNDGNIIVEGTNDPEIALQVAKHFWSKQLPHLTCYRWGAHFYHDSPNQIIVTCGDVG